MLGFLSSTTYVFVFVLGDGVDGAGAESDVDGGVVQVGLEVAEGRVSGRVAKGVDVKCLPVQVFVFFLLSHRRPQLTMVVWVWKRTLTDVERVLADTLTIIYKYRQNIDQPMQI